MKAMNFSADELAELNPDNGAVNSIEVIVRFRLSNGESREISYNVGSYQIEESSPKRPIYGADCNIVAFESDGPHTLSITGGRPGGGESDMKKRTIEITVKITEASGAQNIQVYNLKTLEIRENWPVDPATFLRTDKHTLVLEGQIDHELQ